jgi:hypothetical protein
VSHHWVLDPDGNPDDRADIIPLEREREVRHLRLGRSSEADLGEGADLRRA